MPKHLMTAWRIALLEAREGSKLMGLFLVLGIAVIIFVSLFDWQSPELTEATAQLRARHLSERANIRVPTAPDLKGLTISISIDQPAGVALAEGLGAMGATIVPIDEEHAFHLTIRQVDSQIYYWQAQKGDMQTYANAVLDLEKAMSVLTLKNQKTWLEKRPEELFSHAMIARTAGANKPLPILDVMLLMELLSMSYVLILLKGSLVGVEWDMDRTSGRLEPWTLVSEPLWALYGGQALGGALQTFAFVGLSFVVAIFVGFTMPLTVGIAGAALAAAACFTTAIYGVLATMLFRHRMGRAIARIMLSPMNVLLIGGFALLLQREGRGEGLAMVANLSWSVVLGAACAVAITGILMIPIIEWRIGARRQGLRKI